MNGIDFSYALLIYLALAVFWGFVPQAMLSGQLSAVIIQLLCIGMMIVVTWRILAYRNFKLDNRIGLSFAAYIASTSVTNILVWYLQSGAG